MTITRTQLANAQKRLQAAGWHHVMTAMSSDKTTKSYGLLYAKGDKATGAEFWLNQDTFQNLPEGA